jgi:UDP-N-acetyl-D-mannosaminuronic acid dehydrogenase
LKQPPSKIAVVGGAGHVGAPLALVLAQAGHQVLIQDINRQSMDKMANGKMPFYEKGGEHLLREMLRRGRLEFSDQPKLIRAARTIILTVGTPIDEFHNPVTSLLIRCLESLEPHLAPGALVILRSTVAPGTTEFLARHFREKRLKLLLAFCPERVVQGQAIEEIQTLPQIVSGTSPEAIRRAERLFGKIAQKTVRMSPREAEYAKLICNAYRYIQFAATNQLYMMVESAGLNYHRLLEGMKDGYPRMAGIPRAGFAAGPCLMKDTMQLFAFEKHNFALGQVAMAINEGLPDYLVSRLATTHDLTRSTVGILGMAFKPDSDDVRDALSFKLRKIFRFAGAKVFCADPYVNDKSLVCPREILKRCRIVILGVPHRAYQKLKIPSRITLVDPWGFFQNPAGT